MHDSKCIAYYIVQCIYDFLCPVSLIESQVSYEMSWYIINEVTFLDISVDLKNKTLKFCDFVIELSETIGVQQSFHILLLKCIKQRPPVMYQIQYEKICQYICQISIICNNMHVPVKIYFTSIHTVRTCSNLNSPPPKKNNTELN